MWSGLIGQARLDKDDGEVKKDGEEDDMDSGSRQSMRRRVWNCRRLANASGDFYLQVKPWIPSS